MRLKVERYEEMSIEQLAALVGSHGTSSAGLSGGSCKTYGVLRLAPLNRIDRFNSKQIDKLNGVKFGRKGDTEIRLGDFIRNENRPLCLPYASLFQPDQKSAEIPTTAQFSDEIFGL
jgi:hypothetical protein